jgi:prolipoprotein diacylglyceryl transferase
MFVNNLSPEFFSIGPLSFRWYGLLFATGIALSYLTIRWIFKRQKYNLDHLDSVVIYLFFGMVIGARLGHVFFYEASYYLENPIDILKIWNGGLASHGAAIGLLVAYLIWLKVNKIKFSKYIDALVVGFPLTAMFVRIGNFFNSEIIGNKIEAGSIAENWGVIFKRLGEDFPRHPVQLYSAFMIFLVFLILFFSYKRFYKKTPPLFFLFLFMGLYFSGRFTVEFWKDLHGPLESLPITMGQLLSLLPIILVVIYFVGFFPRQKRRRS